MTRKRLLSCIFPALATVFALGQVPRADACSFPRGVQQRLVVPADQATGVAINARFVLVYTTGPTLAQPLQDGLADVTLRAAGDTTLVPTMITHGVGGTPGRTVVYVDPTQPLLANTAYEVLTKVKADNCFDDCLGPDYQVISHFTTSAVSDDAAPSFTGTEAVVPGMRVTLDVNNSCGFSDYVHFQLVRSGAVDASPLLFDVYRGTELVASAQPAADIKGAVPCGGQGPFNAAFLALSGTYHVRAVDLAGNQDVGSAGIALPDLCATVKGPDAGDESAGCDVAAGGRGAPGAGVVLAAALLLLLAARRGRRGRA